MGIFVVLIAAGIAIAITLAAAAEQRRARVLSWQRAAQRAGLGKIEEEHGGLFRGGWLRGRSGPLNVLLEKRKDGNKKAYRTLISVDGLGHLGHGAEGLSLRREDLSTAVRRLLEGEIQIGSPAFDDVHLVQGPSALALALLDAETRRKIADLLAGSVRGRAVRAALRNGVLEVWPRERGRGLPTKHLTAVLEGVIDVAQRLVAPRDLAARIAANIPEEPEAGVRLQGITVLAREFPEHPDAREALRAARADPSREVRLRAAAALGAEGRETLLALVASDATEDSTAAGAVRALSESGADGSDSAGGESGGLAPEET
ncbi:MAG TPA: hypothetical protein VEG34_02425, partial [Thermoanaerobaculia bacterium]|nr:hypothetical protein [Thermoanaerobaculia bacterium]